MGWRRSFRIERAFVETQMKAQVFTEGCKQDRAKGNKADRPLTWLGYVMKIRLRAE